MRLWCQNSFNYLFANTNLLGPPLFVQRPHANVQVDVGLNVHEEFRLKRSVHADEYCWVVVYLRFTVQLYVNYAALIFNNNFSFLNRLEIGTLAVSKPLK